MKNGTLFRKKVVENGAVWTGGKMFRECDVPAGSRGQPFLCRDALICGHEGGVRLLVATASNESRRGIV